MSFDTGRLYSQLNTSGLQQKNQALYQVIYQLIGALTSVVTTVNNINGIITPSGDTIINNIINLIGGDGDGGGDDSGIVPGPQGIQGIPGVSNIPGPQGPIGYSGEDGEDGNQFPPIIGPQGNPGPTGSQGPIGPVIAGLDGQDGDSAFIVLATTSSGGSSNLSAATVTTQENQASNTPYGDLTTPGPAVTLTLVGTTAIIWLSSQCFQSGLGNTAMISVAVSGASTIAPSNDNGALVSSYVAAFILGMSRVMVLTGLTPGSNTFTMKYQNDGGGTWGFLNRSIAVYAP